MRLLVLCQDPGGPVVRHRVLAIRRHIGAEGFDDVAVRRIPKRLAERVALFREARGADLVLLVRKLFTRAELTLLRRSARRLAFDVDDAVMHRDPFRGRTRSRVRAARFAATVRRADLVLAGNPYLAAAAAECAGAATHVVCAPTPIDTQRFVPGPRPGDGRRRIGWIGSRATRPYLSVVAGPLARLLEERPGTVFTVMADRAPDLPFPVGFVPFDLAAEVSFLQSLDVGLMPLTDDPWSRGKCAFKLLQYLACGVPSVASPVGANVTVARDGDVALLADGDAAWHDAVARLLDDERLAESLAQRGREHVLADLSADVLGPRAGAALRAAARPGDA